MLVLLRFLAETSRNYRFQRFLVRIRSKNLPARRSKNLPASVLVKFVMCFGIQEHFLYDWSSIFLLKETSAQGVGFRRLGAN